MSAPNPKNERVKRQYFHWLEEAEGLTERTIDQTARAIADFETFTRHRDFGRFKASDATAFKRALLKRDGRTPAELSSRATVLTKLRQVRKFFGWLAGQSGFRTRINRNDLEYFGLSARDERLARERPGDRPTPTLPQVQHVIRSMPADTDTQKRDRALMACMLLTGVRVSAAISLKLKHVRADRCGIDQDAREVRTKFSKSSTVFFFSVGDDIREFFLSYVDYLRHDLLWGGDDPLFPRTTRRFGRNPSVPAGFDRAHWKTPGSLWRVFKRAYAAAGVPYYTPHSLRRTLARLGQEVCRRPEELKAWSQNLSHDDLTTTLKSYAFVPLHRQCEILSGLGSPGDPDEEALRKYGPLLSNPTVQTFLDMIANGARP